ncbi:MAG: sigma-70 family RNA polymerase sigma factor [Planctomycetota bacterium]
MSPSQPAAADLLVHREFLRRVARELVGDPHGGDELAQEVWLHALQHPPRHGGALRGWLRTTARNLWSNQRRAARRRARRERAVAPQEAVAPSPAEVLAHESLRQEVVGAVLRLDEPFRSAVLLRYYEGLEPREIARRLGVPAATVRTRLSRGLQRLRELLDAGRGGDRRAWMTALASVLRPATPPSPPSSAPLLQPVSMGVAMKKVLFASAFALAVAVGLWWGPEAWRSAAVPPPTGVADVAATASPSAARDASAADPTAGIPAAAPARAPAAVLDADPDAPRVFPGDRGRGGLAGVVLGAGLRPQEGVEVTATPHRGDAPPMLAIADDRTFRTATRTDAAGRFAFADLPCGPVRVLASAKDREASAVAVLAAAPGAEVVLHLEARFTAGGTDVVVVDAASGAPVEGARVELTQWLPRAGVVRAGGDLAPQQVATTGGDGRARFESPEHTAHDLFFGVVIARAADGRCGMRGWRGGARRGLRVPIGAPGGVRGALEGPAPERVEGATVALLAFEALEGFLAVGRRFEAPVRDGAFAFDELPAGTYGVVLEGAGPLRLRTEPLRHFDHVFENSAALPRIEVRAGERAELALPVEVGARLEGIAVSGGRPVAGARVHAILAPHTSHYGDGLVIYGAHLWRFGKGMENAPRSPASSAFARTDADGRYVLDGLPSGRLRVQVAAAGLSFDRRHDVEVRAGGTTSLRHELAPAGVLQVAGRDVSWLGVSRPGAAEPTMLATIEDDCATFPGLAAGDWLVQRYPSDGVTPPILLGEARVLAGRTTWLDLRDRNVGAVLTGRVRSGGDAVAGAMIYLGSRAARTDAQGEFRVESGHPLWFEGGQNVELRVLTGGGEYGCVPTADDPVVRDDLTIELGTRRLDVEVLDAEGRPVAARVELRGAQDAARPIRSYSAVRRTDGAAAAAFGSVPPLPLQGVARYGDGHEVTFDVAADHVGPVRVQRPATVPVVLRLVRDGAPLRRSRVTAWAWPGPDPAPADDEVWIAGAGEPQSRRADANGALRLQLPPGEVLFAVELGLLQQVMVRRTVDAATAITGLELDVR